MFSSEILTYFKEILYYCDVYDDSQLEIHRGNKYGPVIARSGRCRTNPGSTDILLTEPRPRVRPAHLHHDENSSSTHFVDDGRKYHWNKQRELIDEQNGHVIAQLSLVKDSTQRNGGKLTIKPEGYLKLTEPIVMTAFMVQERFDESHAWF
jgi:hypothetical protein